jgi:hypothetical protein
MNIWKFGLAALGIAIVSLSSDPSFAQSGVRIGSLSCTIQGGVGLILGSSRSMTCTFRPNTAGQEHYTGRVTRVGLDIGVTSKSQMVWAVFAPGRLHSGSLAGSYGGVSAQATVGVGLGAHVLVGGFKHSIALQPLSIQAQTGLNVAAGVSGLRLTYAGR